MAAATGPQTVRLPNGQTFTVGKVFAGFGFRSHSPSSASSSYHVGWTIVLQTEGEAKTDDDDDDDEEEEDKSREVKVQAQEQHVDAEDSDSSQGDKDTRHTAPGEISLPVAAVDDDDDDSINSKINENNSSNNDNKARPARLRPYTRPTLCRDSLFISSISNPSSSDVKPAASPTRQMAMMLWATLYWYFHQPDPGPGWRVHLRPEGVFRSRNLIPKLERMGLVAAESSAVGAGSAADDDGSAWDRIFVSRSAFWQLPGRIFLFALQPLHPPSSSPSSPVSSRPGSPVIGQMPTPGPAPPARFDSDLPGAPMPLEPATALGLPLGPFFSSSHLPTYYPPAPLQYTLSPEGVRHPLRPKPPRVGEIFYSRFIPSASRYLCFRVASSSPQPVPYFGPLGPLSAPSAGSSLCSMSDDNLLRSWHQLPRVSHFWGPYRAGALDEVLSAPHSFPVIGLWDGVPFGYFEIYWVQEDLLGRHAPFPVDRWDRGLHILIGESWARGRVPLWLHPLIHWCFMADARTMNICLEPRVDNDRMLHHLEAAGFARKAHLTLPHKQAWFMALSRDAWEGPAL